MGQKKDPIKFLVRVADAIIWAHNERDVRGQVKRIFGKKSKVVDVCKADELEHIRATVQDDENKFEEIEFNAVAFFEEASFKEVEALVKEGFGNDYGADAVAQFFDGCNPEVTDMFKYIGDGVGFECTVDANDVREWLLKHRPKWHKKLEEHFPEAADTR